MDQEYACDWCGKVVVGELFCEDYDSGTDVCGSMICERCKEEMFNHLSEIEDSPYNQHVDLPDFGHQHEIGTTTTFGEPTRFWCRHCSQEFDPSEEQIAQWKSSSGFQLIYEVTKGPLRLQ